MKKLLFPTFLILLVNQAIRAQPVEEPFPLFNLYWSDTVIIQSATYPKDMPVLVWCEDKTVDGIQFTLNRCSYVMYVPEMNTIFRVSGITDKIPISDHFIATLLAVRELKRKQYYFK